jgi:hypothetical protein
MERMGVRRPREDRGSRVVGSRVGGWGENLAGVRLRHWSGAP